MNKIQVTQPTFLINLDNPTEVSYEPMDGNWKSIMDGNWKPITVQTYLYGFPKIKDNEILYVFKEEYRGYVGKHYELNKKYIEGDIEYEYTKLGSNTLIGIYYRGDSDPVRKIEKFIRSKVSTENYTEYVDMNMDNPWVRIIVIGGESKFLFTK